jgi:hypothetical protein
LKFFQFFWLRELPPTEAIGGFRLCG